MHYMCIQPEIIFIKGYEMMSKFKGKTVHNYLRCDKIKKIKSCPNPKTLISI